jgi:hypothetical protein
MALQRDCLPHLGQIPQKTVVGQLTLALGDSMLRPYCWVQTSTNVTAGHFLAALIHRAAVYDGRMARGTSGFTSNSKGKIARFW